MSSIAEEQLLDLSAETTAMIASCAAMVVVVKGTKPSARVELYSVKVNALIAAYRAEVAAREKAESERKELRAALKRMMDNTPEFKFSKLVCGLCGAQLTHSEFAKSECHDSDCAYIAARDLLARLKDGGV